jgi:uroporphyrinogen-III synthase
MELTGKTIALAECRQADELARLFEKEGATPLRVPLIAIHDQPDEAVVLRWLDQLEAGQFDYLVLLTGEGVRRLHGFAKRNNREAEYVAALSRTILITRGPKPVRALKELGLSTYKVAEKPTTEGVIATLSKEVLAGKQVGVQLYSPENVPLSTFLKEQGATEHAVLPYVYAPDSDTDHVVQLIERMERGEIDMFVVTSSPQISRLQEVAKERHLEASLDLALKQTPIAAIGPIAADSVRAAGYEVAVLPDHGFVMKNLVIHVKKSLA